MKKFLSVLVLVVFGLCFISCDSNAPTDFDSDGGLESDRKITYDVDIELETSNINDLNLLLIDKATELGGYLVNAKTNDSDNPNNSYGTASYKVPTEKLNDFINFIEEKSEVTQKQMTMQDVTNNHDELVLNIETLEAKKALYLEKVVNATNDSDRIRYEELVNKVDEELIELKAQYNKLINSVNMSYVEIIFNGEDESFFSGYARYIGGFFVGLFKVILYMLPFAIVVGGILVIVYMIPKISKKKKEKNEKKEIK